MSNNLLETVISFLKEIIYNKIEIVQNSEKSLDI